MSERSIFDQLDDAVTALLARSEPATVEHRDLNELIEIARELRDLPSSRFRAQLKEQLKGEEVMSTPAKQFETTQTTRAITPYLTYINAAAAMDFYQRAFGAVELMRLVEPGGRIGHSEMKIGDAIFMMADEYPDYGAISAQTLGGSPIKLHIYVADVDRFAEHAIAAGAIQKVPVKDQFYGDRSGQLLDPFGYTWIVSTHKQDLEVEAMQKAFTNLLTPPTEQARDERAVKNFKREGFHTVTPYLTVEPAAELVDFVKNAFGAVEAFRTTGSAGGMHCEVKIGDSVVAIGGGPGFEPRPAAIHLYVDNPDEVYAKAIAAGATSLSEPSDQEYGERVGAIRDIGGNEWYIASRFDKTPIKDLHTVTVYFHPVGSGRFIEFLQTAFGAEVQERHQSEEGFVYHAKLRVGDSMVELGEAHDQWQPLSTAIYMFVEDVDAAYQQALSAGATSVRPPTDEPYGERSAWVNDPFGHTWYLATLQG